MSVGLILNATICFAITVSSFAFAWVLASSADKHNEKSRPALWALVILWSLVSLTYLPTTIRMLAAATNHPALDLIMYNLAAVPFSMVTVPIVFFILYVITGDQKISGYISFMFIFFGATYLAFLYSNGVIGPNVTGYSSMFSINSDIAVNIYLIGLFVIPTAMILGMMFLICLQRMPRRLSYRTALPLVAISFVFDFMLTDIITDIDVMQMASRIFVFIGTVLAYLAYFPPSTLQKTLGIKNSQQEIYEDEEEENDF
ncbi:MAG: hypothetical protein H5T43_08980 [Methanomethylovorans sp.]|nr:hypothetical protein [Methanomethylovorans sp.]